MKRSLKSTEMLGDGQEGEKHEGHMVNTYILSIISQFERFSIQQNFNWIHEQKSQVAQICATMDGLGSIATLTHEMDVGRQKLRKKCDFTWSIVTLSHEMDVGRQKLRN